VEGEGRIQGTYKHQDKARKKRGGTRASRNLTLGGHARTCSQHAQRKKADTQEKRAGKWEFRGQEKRRKRVDLIRKDHQKPLALSLGTGNGEGRGETRQKNSPRHVIPRMLVLSTLKVWGKKRLGRSPRNQNKYGIRDSWVGIKKNGVRLKICHTEVKRKKKKAEH